MTIKNEKEDEIVVEPGNNVSRREREFPEAFFCPLTKQLMEDPVVDGDGESFERKAVIERDKGSSATYYPNRALKAIITREVERHSDEGSMRGNLRRFEESVRGNFKRIVEKSAIPSGQYRPLPDSFYCPITLELINKPVIDPDGNTYERRAISNWIRANGNSPVTRNTLAVEQLRDNNALTDLIDGEKERTDDSIHPSIRRWKDTHEEEEPEEEQNYPTTQAEIEERQTATSKCTVVSILFVLFVLFFALLVLFPSQIIIWVLFLLCCLASNKRGRNRNDDG